MFGFCARTVGPLLSRYRILSFGEDMTQYHFQNKVLSLIADSALVFETIRRRCHFCGIVIEGESLLSIWILFQFYLRTWKWQMCALSRCKFHRTDWGNLRTNVTKPIKSLDLWHCWSHPLPFSTLGHICFLYSSLLELFNNCQKEPEFREDGSRFVELIAKLMEILLDYRTVVLGGDNIDNRMSCTVSVLVSWLR